MDFVPLQVASKHPGSRYIWRDGFLVTIMPQDPRLNKTGFLLNIVFCLLNNPP